ncbi:MAG TPA: hypothetical protein VFD56_11615, partial [Chitinophagaceae bacterium]|nr:hypothetical protein [Chitinophagaceae bacterium]
KIFPVVMLFSAINGFAQTEKFDIATFAPPTGWQRTETNGSVAFLDAKTENGLTSFCQIILYPSVKSSGKVDKDFKTAWDNLVTVPARSNAKPVTQTEKTPDGWTVVTGSANIVNERLTYKTIVSSITGFGKNMNVQINTAGGDYGSVLDKFFNDLDLDSKATVANNDQDNSSLNARTKMTGTIILNDYDFLPPKSWQVQINKDHILLQNLQSGCAIRILEPQPSSGNLEQDVNNVFEMMYKGWQYQKSGEYKFVLSKGYLFKGLEYFMKSAAMNMTGGDGRYNLEEGVAMVVKTGSQVVIISGRHNSSTLGHRDCEIKYDTWPRFFNSFTVKNTDIPKNTDDAGARIIGAWSQTESGASSEYVFAANGHYALVGAIGSTFTSSDINYEYLHIKTYAFRGDGNYSISGNQLTLKKNGGIETFMFRFEQVNHGGVGWKDRICFLKTDAHGQSEVRYEKRVK